MKTLIIGKNGQVGFELCQRLEAISVDYPEIDLAKPESIREVVRAAKPELIINAAAYTAVDQAEQERDFAFSINAKAPAVLAEEANKSDALLVHYSTEYVFDGKADKPYKENDQPNPLSCYGESKLLGDQAILSTAKRHLILRTSWVYGARGKNFLLTMLRLGASGKPLRIVSDQIGAPTCAKHLAEATSALLPKALKEEISGLYNATNQGYTSWFGFAQAIFNAAGLNPSVTPISTEEYPTPAARPKNSRLNGEKLARDFGYSLPQWQEGLDVLESLSNQVC